MSRGTDSRLARQMVEEEFEGQTRSPLGCLSWLGIGGLFATVFLFCGGLGALAAGRELWLESRAAQQGRAGLNPSVRDVRADADPPEAGTDEDADVKEVVPPAPAPEKPRPRPARTPDDPSPRRAGSSSAASSPRAAPSQRSYANDLPAPPNAAEAPQPVAPQPAAPQPQAEEDLGMEIETNDLLDPWAEEDEEEAP